MTEPPSTGPGESDAAPRRPVPAVPEAPRFALVWAQIKEHKVAQWTLAYAAAAYTLLHVAEMVGSAFHWPELIIRVITVTLAPGVPIAIILAWYHGHKAKHRISGLTGKLPLAIDTARRCRPVGKELPRSWGRVSC